MKFKDMPYQRIEFDKVKAEFNELLNEFKEAKSPEECFDVHKKKYQFFDDIITTSILASIRHDIDTKDAYYEKEKEYWDNMLPYIEKMENEYKDAMYHSKYRDYLEEKIGPVAFKDMEISLKAFDEKLIPLMQEENALITSYNSLIAGAEIDWEGETLNLSLLRKYQINPDRSIREKAHTKYWGFLAEHADELDEIYDKLVKNRTKQANMLGYENYIELGYYRQKRNCYDQEMVENFRKQIKEYFVPFAEKVHERRRERLGLETLSYIDEGVYFKGENPAPDGTPEEIMVDAKKMYGELSEETKEFFDFMTENEMFDVLGRKTKNAGGYMIDLPKYNAPFIFANFNGTSDDVDVMTHECGHAFQGYLAGKDPIKEHKDITNETAEVHSMSMEFFTEPWMKLFFKDQTEDYIEMHLESAVEFIPYGCMVDEFQHIVYANPEMTPKQRNEAWCKLEKVYRPHMNYAGNEYLSKGAFWQKQLHIYNYPFYYIEYCLAQTCAFQFKIKMDENYKEAWESYLKLCKLSASDYFVNMIKEVGLMSPFEDGCIKKVIEKLSEMLVK